MPIYDTQSILNAGINPSKNILKYSNSYDQYNNRILPNFKNLELKYQSLYNIMQNHNFIETIERYRWVNVPFGLKADLIERILYNRGKGVFYYNDNIGKFQFLPFALNGFIDEYGRYLKVNTHAFTGVENLPNSKKNLVYENLNIVYDMPFNESMINNINNKNIVGIILDDSTIDISQQPIIRKDYVQPILRLMASLMQIINTAIYGCADHNLLQVTNEEELISLNSQIDAINFDILNGKRFTGIIGTMPLIPLKTSNTADLEGLFNTFNSLNNLLKSITGVVNAGVFDKKAHLLQAEQQLNGSNSDDIYYNGLRLRQEFCLLIQAYYNYPVWCESKRGIMQSLDFNTQNDNNDNNQNVVESQKNE